MTSCHQTFCYQDSSLVSVPSQRKEFPSCSLWIFSLQGAPVHRYACTLHFCFSDSASLLKQVARTTAMVCARWILLSPGLGRIQKVWAAAQCHRCPWQVWHHVREPLCLSPKHKIHVTQRPPWKSNRIPLQVIHNLAKGLGLSHFYDCKNQKVMSFTSICITMSLYM